MLLDAVLERFIAHSPMAVAVRGAFEYALDPAHLDDLFVRIAGDRDDRELLFSTCVDLMATVVCRVRPSVHAAYQADDHLPVSASAVYARLARVPVAAGRELVRHTAARLGPVIRTMGGAEPDPLPGYRVKVLDGNHLGKTQRRIKPLRDVVAGPLPGQALVVLDPALGLAIDVVCCEDGHAQERSLLDPILETVAANDVWVADRNFCTTAFLFGIAGRNGFFVIRRHAATLAWDREPEWAGVGRTGTGALDEQTIWLTGPDGAELAVRRVRLTLDHPTRDGDRVIEVLTNLPAEAALAAVVAELYRGRWSVEGLFLRLTTVLKCEVETLGYPKAALFAFGVALVAFNVLQVVKAAIGAGHGIDAGAEVSGSDLAEEVAGTRRGMAIAIAPSLWSVFARMTPAELGGWLRGLGRQVWLAGFRKQPRGPKKPRPHRESGAEVKRYATARLLQKRNQK